MDKKYMLFASQLIMHQVVIKWTNFQLSENCCFATT